MKTLRVPSVAKLHSVEAGNSNYAFVGMTEVMGGTEHFCAEAWARQIGRSVRRIRVARGWTQSELATSAGMTQPAIARVEAGTSVPTLRVLHRLAHALSVNLVVELSG